MEPKILKTEFLEYASAQYSGKNESGFKPLGDRVLVLPDTVQQQTTGGIHLTEEMVARQSMAATTGVLVELGDGAFAWNSDRSRPFDGVKPKSGDRVQFQRYAGQGLFGKDGKHYRVIDDNVIAAIEIEGE